ncbi:ParA family protein [Sphingomonas sp.]|uniref:ParA family protein n=1 Tax=Sphingomonas sp. TaxID=28214 RepID=UPI0025FAF9B5|nr:ParA family protein [Sphingomonas sp.]
MATVAIYSLKGGVGKTTLAVNLAWCSATLSSRRTLLWDLDPQAASSFLIGEPGRAHDHAQAIFSKDVNPTKLVQHSGVERLDLIPADTSLRGLDLLFHELDKKKRLAKLLGQLDSAYDRMLLDCPPGLTETSEQVMRAADLIVVPVVPSPLSARALDEVSSHLAQKGGKAVPLMPVLSMVDRRRKLHVEAVEAHPDWPVIPAASLIEAMAVRRQPLGAYARRSPGGEAFAELWREVERRLAAK